MRIVYQAGARPERQSTGLSGAPVRRVGLSSSGEVVYADVSGDVVLADGSLFNGSFRDDTTSIWYAATSGKARPLSGVGGATGGSATGGTNSTTTRKKCCNCVTNDVNENWYLTATKRTPQDVPVQITRQKTVCQDPNLQVKIDCNRLKSAAGLQGLGSLSCGCESRM